MVDNEISDSECVLAQFVREKNVHVQVGFQAWLENRDDLESDKEVAILWPKNVIPLRAKSMKKLMTVHPKPIFHRRVIKILSHGGELLKLYLHSWLKWER